MNQNQSDRISLSGTTTTASISKPRRLYITNLLRDASERSYKFSVHFQNAIQDCKAIRLLNALVSLNAYNFCELNNQITFTALNNYYSIPIDKQQYNTPQAVATAVNNVFQFAVPDSMFSLSWDAYTLRYSLKNTNSNPAYYSAFTNGVNSIWKKLGFDETQLNVPMNNTTVVANNAPKLARTSCIYISSPSISTNEGVANTNVNSIFQRKNILAVIPVLNANYGAYNSFNDPIDIFRAVALNPVIQTLQFELYDEEFHLFDDLDANTTVSLELDLEY